MNQDQDGWRRGTRLRQLPRKTATTQDQTAQAPPNLNTQSPARKRKRGRPAAAAVQGQQQSQQPQQQQEQGYSQAQAQQEAQNQPQGQGQQESLQLQPPQRTLNPEEEKDGDQPTSKKQATTTTNNNNNTQAQLKTSKGVPVQHWIQNVGWPADLFESDMNRIDNLRRSSVADKTPTTPRSRASSYNDENCVLYLEAQGSFMAPHGSRILDEDKKTLRDLASYECATPQDTIFDDDTYGYLEDRLEQRNEMAVLILLSQVLVPSAEIATRRGTVAFRGLIDSIDEPWAAWIPLGAERETSQTRLQQQQPITEYRPPRPQPDYSVGVSEGAFSKAQLNRLAPILGPIGTPSFYKGTLRMLFPFLTSEAKSAKRILLEASKQNAHSMTCALRGVVKLFQLVKREKELHQRILGFSADYDNQAVRWYGHYVVVDDDDDADADADNEGAITYHRHSIRSFDYRSTDGSDRWGSYKFAMAIYNQWVPEHFARLCSAIDTLPETINFGVDPDSTPQAAASEA